MVSWFKSALAKLEGSLLVRWGAALDGLALEVADQSGTESIAATEEMRRSDCVGLWIVLVICR